MKGAAFLVAGIVIGCSPGTAPIIELRRGIAIRSVADSVDPGAAPIERSSNGYFAVRRLLPPTDGVAIYDSSGALVSLPGRRGPGPGEFDRPVNDIGFGPGDSLYVIETGRLHVFSPPPLVTFVRTVTTSIQIDAVTPFGLRGGPSQWNGKVAPIRLFGWDGEESKTFSLPAEAGAEMYGSVVTHPNADEVWIGREWNYQIELIAADGTIRRRINRSVDWFPPNSRMTGMPWVVRPPPSIVSLHDDGEGQLWVLVRRAHRDWEKYKAGLVQAPGNGPVVPQQLRGIDPAQLFETVLDVFEIESGRFIASLEMNGHFVGFSHAGSLTEVSETETGEVTLQQWHVRLVRPD